MNLELYTLFLVLAIVLIGVGLFQKEGVHAIIGFSFLFVLGVILMGGSGIAIGAGELTQMTGQNITTVSPTLTTVDYVYAPITDATTIWIGRLIAIGAVTVGALFENKPWVKWAEVPRIIAYALLPAYLVYYQSLPTFLLQIGVGYAILSIIWLYQALYSKNTQPEVVNE